MNIPTHKETSKGKLAIVETETILPRDAFETTMDSSQIWKIEDNKENDSIVIK